MSGCLGIRSEDCLRHRRCRRVVEIDTRLGHGLEHQRGELGSRRHHRRVGRARHLELLQQTLPESFFIVGACCGIEPQQPGKRILQVTSRHIEVGHQ